MTLFLTCVVLVWRRYLKKNEVATKAEGGEKTNETNKQCSGDQRSLPFCTAKIAPVSSCQHHLFASERSVFYL